MDSPTDTHNELTPVTSAPAAEPPQLDTGTDVQRAHGELREPEGTDMVTATPQEHQATCKVQNAKNQGKSPSNGRRYVSSTKAMTDPLKMDIFALTDEPFTSSQLSLECSVCHIIFSDQKSIVRHLKLSHPDQYEQYILGNALFTCYVCDSHFTNSAELMTHQKAHTERNPFKCPICSMTFKKCSELTSHKKSHGDPGSYSCSDCGQVCKTIASLKYHRRTHTGELPYVCKKCGERFPIPKALKKHILSHSAEGSEGNTVKVKKNDERFFCAICKASFKSPKSRLHHMRKLHNMLTAAANNALRAATQKTQAMPIITPIPVCQPGILQVEPNGPLQKVDSNIDTEQICRLIESFGNVQKVNQVVILGQVPPHSQPLELQQISQLAEPVHLSPPQMDFMGLKQSDSKTIVLNTLNTHCDGMEQTIILEPITPDGQLDNNPFSELGTHLATGQNIQLTLVQTEQTERPEGDMMHQIIHHQINEIQSMDHVVCSNELDNFKENLEQTVILELIPTSELEQTQTEPHTEIPTSSLVSASELEKTSEQSAMDKQDIGVSVPPLMATVELELTDLQTEQQDLPSSACVPPDTLTHTPPKSETTTEKDSQIQAESPEESHGVMDAGAQPQKLQEGQQEDPGHEIKMLSLVDDESAKGEVSETKQAPQISELPVSVMSAQELVKVRKRKPAKAFFFQGCIQEQISSVYSDDLHMNAKPSKRQRTRRSHLVVKMGPQSKEKKNKKQKRPSHQHQQTQKEAATNMTENKVPKSPKGGKKRKKERKVAHLGSKNEKNLSSSTEDSPVKQMKEQVRKNKMKRQKEVRERAVETSEQQTVGSPVLKKRKQARIMHKDQGNNKKRKKNLSNAEKVEKDAKSAAGSRQDPTKTPDSLLLLKGHKQPQLKVYKLDPTKASGQAQEALPQVSPAQQSKHISIPAQESKNDLPKQSPKKVGRAKKAQRVLSLLSSLVTRQPPEKSPANPKPTRKRKSSSKVEAEGVITSRRALECKDCGERFSELSSLQRHKATVHIIESPDLTYTNGNIFEGVSRLNIYQCDKASDWDTEPELGEMALEDREQTVSFPALIPSPTLPVLTPEVGINTEEEKSGCKEGVDDQSQISLEVNPDAMPSSFTSESVSCNSKDLETEETSAAEGNKQEKGTQKHPSSESESQAKIEEDIKEDLLLDVNLVTVGDQNEKDDPVLPQSKAKETAAEDGGNIKTLAAPGQVDKTPLEQSLTSQTVSCSTHQLEIKEEEEEILVQRSKDGYGAVTKGATSGRNEETECLKSKVSKTITEAGSGAESENVQDECQVVYEMHPIHSDSEAHNETETGIKTSESKSSEDNKAAATPDHSPFVPSVLEGSPGEQVVFGLESVTTSVDAVMNDGGGQQDRDADRSPGIILEKFLTFGQRETSENAPSSLTPKDNQRQDLPSINENVNVLSKVPVHGSQEIKVEENISDQQLVEPTCQNKQCTSVPHQVKEESSSHIRWNMEPANSENTAPPITQSEETSDSPITPEFSSSQCIFYPVKEEQKEVLLEATETGRQSSTPGGSSAVHHTELHGADGSSCEGAHAAQDYHEIRGLSGVGDFADGQDESEWPNPPDLQDFLLHASDEEETDALALPDPQRDSEEEVLANFYKEKAEGGGQSTSQNVITPTTQLQAQGDGTSTKKPMDYFSVFFGWDTWADIASCTNKSSSTRNSVSASEVAQFVGIHIAMGTLKFPSPRLYWEDLTKVPLVADAMPLSRFLELSRSLKLASSAGGPVNSHDQEERRDGDFQHGQQGQSDTGSQCQKTNDFNFSPSDPLRKVQPLLCRFKAACQALRKEGDYGVDQYLLPLTGKPHSGKYSLHCTTLIGFGGSVLHVDLKLNLSDKEDAVEKMVPKGSMVFLCKQELSTPAMLERLLAAGIHGAGRVGGARGQIGDEFVSSDGKLMLRRSQCGFILSTAGNGQRNMASLIGKFEKAQMSARLNRDLRNLYPTPLTASAPTCWPQAVLWYLADLALVNSWLQYRQDHRSPSAPLTLMDFRLEVSKSLILSSGSDAQDSVPAHPPKDNARTTNESPNPRLVEESPLPDAAMRYDGSGHWPEQLAEGEGGRCRFRDCQRTSRVLCLKCCVFLCISRNHNCFLNFHNQSLGKE